MPVNNCLSYFAEINSDFFALNLSGRRGQHLVLWWRWFHAFLVSFICSAVIRFDLGLEQMRPAFRIFHLSCN